MSAVSPGAFLIFSLRYLPRPSWVMPRWTGHAELLRHLGELHRVVLAGPDRFAEVLADLRRVDVEGGREFDVADVVAAEVDVHQARDLLGGVGVAVVVDALDEGRGAVADADDRDAHLLGLVARGAVVEAAPLPLARPFVCCLLTSAMSFAGREGPVEGREPSRAPWLALGRERGAGRSNETTPGPGEGHTDSSRRTCQMRCATVIRR